MSTKNSSELEKKVDELLSRGVQDAIVKEDLRKKLLSGKKLRIKYGIDPTGPKVHLGRASTMRKLAKFQELGHQIVLIIGDFTAQVGDASDKDSERPMLEKQQIEENMKGYLEQLGKIFDISRAEVCHNSQWLGRLDFNDICRLADNFSVAEMLDRENFSQRFKSGKRISLREFMYPLMQGYDSVAIKSDVEIGGTDQLFNVLAGRTIQKALGQEPQNVLTFQLLEGTDGRKMSTSWGNFILIADSPREMFGKVMSVKDELIEKYFLLCTDVDLSQVRAKLASPREAKLDLAEEIVKIYHGASEAEKARQYFLQVFSQRELPEDAAEISLPAGSRLVDCLEQFGLAKSKGEAKKKISQKGVSLDGQPVGSVDFVLDQTCQGKILKVGKRNFRKIKIAG